jgi:hypothetical protein
MYSTKRFYNATRRHSTIGYLSPVEVERKVGQVIWNASLSHKNSAKTSEGERLWRTLVGEAGRSRRWC